MGKYTEAYRNEVLHRYDEDGIIHYFTCEEMEDLTAQPHFFMSGESELRGFLYRCGTPRKDHLIVFCHGLGGGHRSYLREIGELCREGYAVFAYDNTGCFASEGESILGFTQSAADLISAIHYIRHLSSYSQYRGLYVIGHSMGAWACAVAGKYVPNIEKMVLISVYVSVRDWMKNRKADAPLTKFARVREEWAHEKSLHPDYAADTFFKAQERSFTRILLAHSTDDPLSPFSRGTGLIQKKKTPRCRYLIRQDRGHNPNYTKDASDYLQRVFGEYTEKIQKGTLKTEEDRNKFMSDVDWNRMTEQDPDFWADVFAFLDEE